MALGLRIILEVVQALLRVWNKEDEGNLLENVAQTSTASGDGAASQAPGTPSRLANVQTIHGRPLNAAGLREVENTNKGLSDPGVHIDMAKKAPRQEKQLPVLRSKGSSEVTGKGDQTKSVSRCRDVKLRKAGRAGLGGLLPQQRHEESVGRVAARGQQQRVRPLARRIGRFGADRLAPLVAIGHDREIGMA